MVPHEISHLMLNQATWNPFNSPPNWLDEGLAVYLQETQESRFRQILDDAVDDGQLIPVRALNSSFPLDPDQARLVELRYFGGLSVEETAETLGISPATVKRRWASARAFLAAELSAS